MIKQFLCINMVDFCISGHISNINVSTLRYTYNIIIMVASFAALQLAI